MLVYKWWLFGYNS